MKSSFPVSLIRQMTATARSSVAGSINFFPRPPGTRAEPRGNLSSWCIPSLYGESKKPESCFSYLLHGVCGYEKQLSGFFDSANDGDRALISGGSNDFVPSTTRIARESAVNSSGCDHPFDVGKYKIIVCHLFKEVREGELVVAIQHFASNHIDYSQTGQLLSRDQPRSAHCQPLTD